MLVLRSRHLTRLHTLLAESPIVAIIGARQIGKTTLARQLAQQTAARATVFDLENPRDLARLEDPLLALEGLKGLVILDEIQRRPELFPILRVLADRRPLPTRFLVLGSASPDLLQQSSESLAGRIQYYPLGGFALDEIDAGAAQQLWMRGGFPAAFLAPSLAASVRWRENFVQTFLERDLPQLGVRVPAITLRRFWTMLAHYHAQIWNGAELARAFGMSVATVRRYLDTLTAALVLRQLPPWFENLGKRQVKAPKIYVADSGLLHTLLGVETGEDLERHPRSGRPGKALPWGKSSPAWAPGPSSAFSGPRIPGRNWTCWWSGNRRWGFEFKRTVAPRLTRSMHSALADLRLERLDVVHAGTRPFHSPDRVRALALPRLLDDLDPLPG